MSNVKQQPESGKDMILFIDHPGPGFQGQMMDPLWQHDVFGR